VAFAAAAEHLPQTNPVARAIARIMRARANSPLMRAVDAAPAHAPRILLGRHVY